MRIIHFFISLIFLQSFSFNNDLFDKWYNPFQSSISSKLLLINFSISSKENNDSKFNRLVGDYYIFTNLKDSLLQLDSKFKSALFSFQQYELYDKRTEQIFIQDANPLVNKLFFDFLNNKKEISSRKITSNHFIIDKNGNNIGFYNWPSNYHDCDFTIIIKGQSPVGHPMVMFRTEEVIKLGGYNHDFKFVQDVDLWFRGFGENHRFNNIQHRLAKYRKVNTQLSYKYSNDLNNEGNKAYVDLINRINHLKNNYNYPVYNNLIHINNLIRNAPNEINNFLEIKRELLQYFFTKHSFDNKQILYYTSKLWVHLFPYLILDVK